jgi:hypothetical protein
MLNCCILGPNWIFNFAERSRHWIRYIMEGTNEKLHKIFVDTGAMTTLQSSDGNLTAILPLGSEARKRMIKLAI